MMIRTIYDQHVGRQLQISFMNAFRNINKYKVVILVIKVYYRVPAEMRYYWRMIVVEDSVLKSSNLKY